jgi:ABC-type Zn uptake system ZnuABC Zn-binding protein ZnuA
LILENQMGRAAGLYCKSFAITFRADYRFYVSRWAIYCCLLAGMVLQGVAAPQKPKILTTFSPIYSFTVNITGDLAEVENLLSGSIDVHDYQLSPADLKKIRNADLIVANGLGMEPFLDKVLASAEPAWHYVETSRGCEAELIHDAAGNVNPHVWLDPDLAARAVTNILRELQLIDPARSAAYASNAAVYLHRIQQLDAQIARELRPVRHVSFITQHSAFAYWARHYHLQLVGVVEKIPEVNPTPRELTALHRTIRARKVKALFVPPGRPGPLERQICKDSGIALEHLDSLEIGEPAARAYESGMKKNADALLRVLR